MSLHIAVFEDDVELAELVQEILGDYGFQVSCHYTVATDAWKTADVVLADYRNRIVSFHELCKLSEAERIPMVAISGAETSYSPQVMKPFRIEVLKETITNAVTQFKMAFGEKLVAPPRLERGSTV